MFDFNTKDYGNLKTTQLKRMADYWQRQYLLSKAKRNGYNQIYCPLKNKYYPESKIQASHFRDRSDMCYRYDKDNVHLISSASNMWDAKEQVKGCKSKHHKEYETWLRTKVGDKKVDKLLSEPKKYCIFARQDYIDTIENFRNNVR